MPLCCCCCSSAWRQSRSRLPPPLPHGGRTGGCGGSLLMPARPVPARSTRARRVALLCVRGFDKQRRPHAPPSPPLFPREQRQHRRLAAFVRLCACVVCATASGRTSVSLEALNRCCDAPVFRLLRLGHMSMDEPAPQARTHVLLGRAGSCCISLRFRSTLNSVRVPPPPKFGPVQPRNPRSKGLKPASVIPPRHRRPRFTGACMSKVIN